MVKFMKYANFYYKLIGIEPYTMHLADEKPSMKARFLFLVNDINLIVILLGEIIYSCTAFKNGELLDGVTVMSYVGFVFVGVSKMLFIRWKRSLMDEMMTELKELYPRGRLQEARYDLQSYLRSCSRISLTHSVLYSILIWTFNLSSVMEYLIYEKWLKLGVVGKKLPYPMYIPWNYEGTWNFYPLLISEIVAGSTSAAGQLSTDLLLVAVVTQLVMHFDCLSRTMENHKLSGIWEEDSPFLRDIVQYHERILRLANVVNEIFGVPLLLNFMVSSFVICFVGFQLTVGVRPDMIVRLILFLFCSMAQVYLICHYGQMVADASSGMSMATYNQNWLHADVRYKRALVIIMARAQKTTYLKATIFLDITRASMTDLLQLSYKFFALLRTMYVQ